LFVSFCFYYGQFSGNFILKIGFSDQKIESILAKKYLKLTNYQNVLFLSNHLSLIRKNMSFYLFLVERSILNKLKVKIVLSLLTIFLTILSLGLYYLYDKNKASI